MPVPYIADTVGARHASPVLKNGFEMARIAYYLLSKLSRRVSPNEPVP